MASTQLDRPWYKLEESLDSMGIYPQNETLGADYDDEALDSVYNLEDGVLPTFTPNFGIVEIERKANLTNLLSSASVDTGLLVDQKIRDILDHFKLPPHQYFPLQATYRRKNVSGYYWLQIAEPKGAFEALDFKRSKFRLESWAPNKVHEELSIESYSDFQNELKLLSRYAEKHSIEEGAYISCTQYVLSESFLKNYDLFRLFRFDADFNVRKEVRKAFEKHDVSGIEFRVPGRLRVDS